MLNHDIVNPYELIMGLSSDLREIHSRIDELSCVLHQVDANSDVATYINGRRKTLRETEKKFQESIYATRLQATGHLVKLGANKATVAKKFTRKAMTRGMLTTGKIDVQSGKFKEF